MMVQRTIRVQSYFMMPEIQAADISARPATPFHFTGRNLRPALASNPPWQMRAAEEAMNTGQAPSPVAIECPHDIAQAIVASSGQDSQLRTLPAHRAAILHIAAEFGMTPAQVAGFYCAELTRLSRTAAVRDYLAVLVTKRVRAQLGLAGHHAVSAQA